MASGRQRQAQRGGLDAVRRSALGSQLQAAQGSKRHAQQRHDAHILERQARQAGGALPAGQLVAATPAAEGQILQPRQRRQQPGERVIPATLQRQLREACQR